MAPSVKESIAKKMAAGSTTCSTASGILQELSHDYQTQVSYSYAGLRPSPFFMTFADGNRCYFHQDVLGSILAVSDGTGEVGGKYSYDAFGNILDQHEKGLHQPLRYTGRPLDEATGFYDFRARFYDSRVGAFCFAGPGSRHILRDPPSFASYLYARDNPVSHTDPSGLIGRDQTPTRAICLTIFLNQKFRSLRSIYSPASHCGGWSQIDELTFARDRRAKVR